MPLFCPCNLSKTAEIALVITKRHEQTDQCRLRGEIASQAISLIIRENLLKRELLVLSILLLLKENKATRTIVFSVASMVIKQITSVK